MEIQQNPTTVNSTQSVAGEIVGLTPAQDDYIAFTALGGLLPDPKGEMAAIKMSAVQFAARIQVNPSTLYEWRKTIPNFWDKVADKRKEISGKDRLAQVWNGIFLKASAGNERAAALYLANFDPNFRMPTERKQIEMGNTFADLIAQHRQQQLNERNVIDATPSPTADA